MAHIHSVSDTDARFSINPLTRQIKNESPRKTTLIQYDHNSERFTFELPRYVEGHDMSLCNKVEVHFFNINPQTKEERSGKYTADDFRVCPENENATVFSWLISQNGTKLSGILKFFIRYKCEDENSVVKYSWNTAFFTGISVGESGDAGEAFETDYIDIIEQWQAKVIQSITNEVNANVSAWAEIESGKVRGEMTAFSAEWNAALEVERARIDNALSLKEGSTTGDAELHDIRVDYTGKLWDNAGDAVRGMAKDIDSAFDVYESPNLLNLETMTAGVGMSAQGKMYDQSAMVLTDYIQVTPGEVIRYQAINKMTGETEFGNMRFVCAFDAGKNIVSSAGSNESQNSYIVPDGIIFVRLTLAAYTQNSEHMVHKSAEIIPYEGYGKKRTVKNECYDISYIREQMAVNSRRIALPSTLYGFVGYPICVYFQNVMDYSPNDVYVRKYGAANKGKQYVDRWEYTPTEAETVHGSIRVFDHNYSMLKEHNIPVVVSATTAKDRLKVLVIGDSTVQAGHETQKMLDLADADGYSLQLIGTLGNGRNLHEGRGGWTAQMYAGSASSSSFTNAFFNPDTENFDFAYYMAKHGYSGVDCVFLQLGINDVFAAQPINIDGAVGVFVENMQFIVDSIHKYNSDIKVVINLIIPCGVDQDAFADYYNLSQTVWQCRKNTYDANISLLDAFAGMPNVYLSPLNAAIDSANNLPNDVHPSIDGYNQLGTQMYSYMRAIN